MKITVYKDESCEMMRIELNGQPTFEGNFWDIGEDEWMHLLKKVGVKVEEAEYKYE